MNYRYKKWQHPVGTTEEYRNNFDSIFRKQEKNPHPEDYAAWAKIIDKANYPEDYPEEVCKTNTTDQGSSDTSPVSPVVPETMQLSLPMDTPTVSVVGRMLPQKHQDGRLLEDGTVEWPDP
jgi:hypothetical protein